MTHRAAPIAAELIADFSLETSDYRRPTPEELSELGLDGTVCAGVDVWLRGRPGTLAMELDNRGDHNRVFINDGAAGRLTLGFDGSGSTVFLGRDSYLADQHIGSRQDGDLVAVGNDVATTGPGRWVSGLRCAPATPALVIGDACVISRDVVLRNSDGHPLMDPTLGSQLNLPAAEIVIEPHCWLGERSAILKDVRIGAFSIIGFGAVVTRDVPRHHTARGNPAETRANSRGFWCWDDSREGLDRARQFLQRYPFPAADVD